MTRKKISHQDYNRVKKYSWKENMQEKKIMRNKINLLHSFLK